MIPVAAIHGGGGGSGVEGDAPDAHGSASGAGLGFVVKDGTVTWSPSIDQMRIVMGRTLVTLAGILVVGRILNRYLRRFSTN